MSRFISAVFAVLAGVASAVAQDSCSDPCPRGILEDIADGYYENHRWPYPYSYADQQAVRDPFVIMVQNGWRRQNLLADYHFLEKTGQLNEAGQTAIRRIAQEVTAQHRMIYVRRALTTEETAARIAAAQQYAAKVALDGNVPPVAETSVRPAGYPAGWPPSREGAVSRNFRVSVPKEMYLPETDKQSGGGGKQ
jgi:hypothetical protein